MLGIRLTGTSCSKLLFLSAASNTLSAIDFGRLLYGVEALVTGYELIMGKMILYVPEKIASRDPVWVD